MQQKLDGEVLPIVVNNNNFAKGEPTLLQLRRRAHAVPRIRPRAARAAVAGALSVAIRHRGAARLCRVSRRRSSSTGWRCRRHLRRYARHYRTGEPLPEALLRRLLAARNFNQGFATVEYTACALLDLDLHARPDPAGLDVAAFERDFLARNRHAAGNRPAPPPGAFPASVRRQRLCRRILRLSVGRGARRRRFRRLRPRPATRSIRRWRRGCKAIYSAGDTADPMELYRAFRGREPAIAPLLEQRGLTG